MSRDRAARALSGPLAGVSRFPRVRLAHSPTPMDGAPNPGRGLGYLIAAEEVAGQAAASRVLFLHTGGLPAVFAYADQLGTGPSKRPKIKG